MMVSPLQNKRDWPLCLDFAQFHLSKCAILAFELRLCLAPFCSLPQKKKNSFKAFLANKTQQNVIIYSSLLPGNETTDTASSCLCSQLLLWNTDDYDKCFLKAVKAGLLFFKEV